MRLAKGWGKRAAGGAWLALWCAALYAVAAPWRELGGLVDERLRWLEWCVLFNGLAVGYTLGRWAREPATRLDLRGYVVLVRYLLYPALGLAALMLAALTAIDRRDPVGVVVTGLMAYWAGLDVAFGAVPLMEKRSDHSS